MIETRLGTCIAPEPSSFQPGSSHTTFAARAISEPDGGLCAVTDAAAEMASAVRRPAILVGALMGVLQAGQVEGGGWGLGLGLGWSCDTFVCVGRAWYDIENRG